MRRQINKYFIENNPSILEEMLYHNRVYGRLDNGIRRFFYMIQLFFKYSIMKSHPLQEKHKRQCKAVYPESQRNQKVQLDVINQKVKENECIICDIWNVLFCETLNRQQILALAEIKLQYIGLSDIPDLSQKLNSEQLQNIENIYSDFVIMNIAVKKILDETSHSGKRVFVYNNSELPNQFINKILKKNGCEYEITSNIENGIHITNRGRHNNEVIYKNIKYMGEIYRPYYYTNVVTAFYNQLVNMKFHSTGKLYSLFYEYGYTCGGILICGFCQFLENLAKQENIDKFLFVARDGDIMSQVYKRYFNHLDSSYLIFSRFASYELIFEDFPDEYIDKNIKTRIDRENTDNSIKKIVSECGLEFICQYLDEEELDEREILTHDNYMQFRKILIRHKEEIQDSFENTCTAAKKYFLREIQGKNKVCIVDLGWHGKSIVYMKHLCERKYGWKGSIVGAMIGASENQIVQTHIRTGLIHTYAFENEYWRNLGIQAGKHMNYKECICLEELFSSPNDTLLRYKSDKDGHSDFIYGKKNQNKKIIEQIHSGILDFTDQFMPVIQKYNLMITPRDAYTPTDACMRNQNYVDMLYERYDEEPNAINGF